jgi:hypothetical protein
MSKKPASQKPRPVAPEGAAETIANLEAGHEAAATMPTDAHLQPAPGIDTEPSESIIAVVARLHARIVSLESRLGALAEIARQHYGVKI